MMELGTLVPTWLVWYAAIAVPVALVAIGVDISLQRRNWRAGQAEKPDQPAPRAFGA